MSYVAYQSRSVGSARPLTDHASFISRMFATLTRYYRLRQVERHLRSLDDRLLHDIGLERSDIGDVVWKGQRPNR